MCHCPCLSVTVIVSVTVSVIISVSIIVSVTVSVFVTVSVIVIFLSLSLKLLFCCSSNFGYKEYKYESMGPLCCQSMSLNSCIVSENEVPNFLFCESVFSGTPGRCTRYHNHNMGLRAQGLYHKYSLPTITMHISIFIVGLRCWYTVSCWYH